MIDHQQDQLEGISLGPRDDIRHMFYRRIAASFAVLFLLVIGGVILWMQRPVCRADVGCGWPVFFASLLITIPIIVLLSWLWGRWHERQTAIVTLQLEREYKQQVGLVDWERRRLATVLNQMADGVVMTDDAGRIQYLNPAAMRILNTGQDEALGHAFAAVAFHHQLIELWQKCRQEREEQTAALEIERRGFFVQAIVSPFQLIDRWGCLVILQDLTRIRRLETVRRDFISNVSHELLTPIAALRAVVETIQDGALDDPPMARHFLNRALTEVDSLSHIVSELLTLSRIESGQVALRLRPVSVAALFSRPLEQFTVSAKRKEIELVSHIPEDAPFVLADAEQIWQVINNIMHNALKYTPAGGRVTLEAKQNEEEPDFIVIVIQDSGIGIPKEDLPRIFERFYKADRSRQRDKASGTGLGLSIAKHIVQAHGGRVWATSKEGKGSSFFLTLPITQNVPSSAVEDQVTPEENSTQSLSSAADHEGP